jgi:hypothetical protein
MNNKIAIVRAAVNENAQLLMEKLANISEKGAMSVGIIWGDHLGYSKKSPRWLPKLLLIEQKDWYLKLWSNFLKKYQNDDSDPSKLKRRVDETLVYDYNPQNK